MSSYSSSGSYGLCRLGSKRLLARKKPLFRKKTSDPLVVLTYFVFFGMLFSGFSSFGL